MRPRQGPKPWSLTIITAAPRCSASSQRLADRIVQPADHLGRRRIPLGVVDAGLVDVQIRPDPVLERVEVLKLDHQDGPVVDDAIGEPAAVGAAAEAVGGQPGVGLQLLQRLRGPLPEVA